MGFSQQQKNFLLLVWSIVRRASRGFKSQSYLWINKRLIFWILWLRMYKRLTKRSGGGHGLPFFYWCSLQAASCIAPDRSVDKSLADLGFACVTPAASPELEAEGPNAEMGATGTHRNVTRRNIQIAWINSAVMKSCVQVFFFWGLSDIATIR